MSSAGIKILGMNIENGNKAIAIYHLFSNHQKTSLTIRPHYKTGIN